MGDDRFLIWKEDGEDTYALDLENPDTLDAIIKLMQMVDRGDVAEVVRCKDCDFWKTEDCVMKDIDGRYKHTEMFCGYGRRSEQNEI